MPYQQSNKEQYEIFGADLRRWIHPYGVREWLTTKYGNGFDRLVVAE